MCTEGTGPFGNRTAEVFDEQNETLDCEQHMLVTEIDWVIKRGHLGCLKLGRTWESKLVQPTVLNVQIPE